MSRWLAVAAGAATAGLLLAGPLGTAGRAAAQEVGQADQAAELTDRFAERVAQALRLESDRADLLRAALQRSREIRGELTARRRSLLRELGAVARQDRVDQERVAQLLEEVLQLQVREAEINVQEQRRLAEFMTPIERARFLWLRQRFLQQARQRGQDVRRDNRIPRDRRPPPAAEQRSTPNTPPRQP